MYCLICVKLYEKIKENEQRLLEYQQNAELQYIEKKIILIQNIKKKNILQMKKNILWMKKNIIYIKKNILWIWNILINK